MANEVFADKICSSRSHKNPGLIYSSNKYIKMIYKIGNKLSNIIAHLLIIINIIIIGINLAIWISSARQNLFSSADFTSFYTGFKMVLEGEGSKLYDHNVQAQYQHKIMGDTEFEGGLLPYLNPPFIAVIFSPLALLPLRTAFYVWSIGNLGLLIWVLFTVNKLFSDWTKQERLITTICILSFWPLTITFLLGQLSLLLLVFVFQMYNYIQKKHYFKAGFWLFSLVTKPQAFLIPFMITLNKKYWRVALSATISSILFIILSGLFVGFEVWVQYLKTLLTINNKGFEYGFYPHVQYTLRGLLTNILSYSPNYLINWISIFFFIFGMFFVWLIWKRSEVVENGRFQLNLAFTIVLTSFLSLHSFPHDSLILVLPAVLFYDYLRQNNYPRKIYGLFILISPPIFFVTAFSNFSLFGFIRPPIILIIIILVWMLYYMKRYTLTGYVNDRIKIIR